MAREFSATTVVVAGTMNMAEAAESGSCVLYARYNRDSPDDEDNVIQSGIGARLYADNRLCGRVWEAESGTNRSVCSPAGAVFTSPQRVLLILLEDRMHIYANGQLAVRDVPIVMRAGSFATALVSEDPNVACEVTDIWAFEAIPLVPGLCTVSTSNTVNQRSGPGTGYAVAGQLSPGQTGTAVGQHDGGDGFIWYQLDGGAWMREDVITLYGDCGSLPDVAP
jgi:hypothetical protein